VAAPSRAAGRSRRPAGELTARGIKIENKDDIKARLGRSPDDGDAITMAMAPGARAAAVEVRREAPRRAAGSVVGYADVKARFEPRRAQ